MVLLLPPRRRPIPRARGSELYHTSYNKRDAASAARALYSSPPLTIHLSTRPPFTKNAKLGGKFLLYRRSQSRELGDGYLPVSAGTWRISGGSGGYERTLHKQVT